MANIWIFHDSHDRFYRVPFGAVPCQEMVALKVKIYAPFEIKRAILRLWKDGVGEKRIPMVLLTKKDNELIYQAKFRSPAKAGLLWYYFIIETNSDRYYYGRDQGGFGGAGYISKYPPHSYQITVYNRGFVTPNWFKHGVMYQIFVDRFYNGNEGGSLLASRDDCIVHDDWYETPCHKPDPKTGEILCNDFFGGNLLGIIKKLPYLKELGVSVLYLNPIFEAFSNHKYDVGNYKKIDPMFGDEEMFQELCSKAEEMGISVILDGVFSHTGSDSIYFNKKGRYPGLGAYQSKNSPYYPWYRFIRYPEKYECWWGINTLPNVNEMEHSYQNYIIHDKDSVAKYWINRGAKGWRLDVVDELPDEFLKAFRKAVKEADPEAVIIGEVWEDATRKVSYGKRREYLLGEELDSTMNYPFRDMVLKFFLGEWDASYFNRGIMSLYENYPIHCFYSLMNLVGTHDVARIKTILGGAPPEHSLSRDQQAAYVMTKEQEQLGEARLKLVSLLQMTFPGVPCIYYGDEAGLWGYRDPFNRATYPWGRENMELVRWYRRIIALRNSMGALRTGEFIPVYYQQDVYGFIRRIHGGRDVFGEEREDGFVLVLLNRSPYKAYTVKLDMKAWGVDRLKDVINGNIEFAVNGGYLEIEMLPMKGRVLVK
jgi:cyclomaltodextrinase